MQFAAFPEVEAVSLGGSQASGAADAGSDIDLYVYITATLPLATQTQIIEQAGGATRAAQNLPYWGGDNVLIDAATGITVDCMYVDTGWIEEQISRVMEKHPIKPGVFNLLLPGGAAVARAV